MATPQFTVQNVFMAVVIGSPNSFEIPVLDVAGDAVNISSGYTVDVANATPASDFNTWFDSFQIESIGTFTKGNGTLTWALTAANTATLESLLPTLNSNVAIAISNDTGTTKSLLARGTLTLDHPVGIL